MVREPRDDSGRHLPTNRLVADDHAPLRDFRDIADVLVTALYDISVTAGDPIEVSVVTTSASNDPLSYLRTPELPSDGSNRRGEYDIRAVAPLTLAYTVGGGDSSIKLAATPEMAGHELRPLRPNGHALKGQYGVVRSILLQIANPTDASTPVSLYEAPIDGPDTATLWFNGDAAPVELGRALPNATYALRGFTVASHQTITANATFMSDGGSWYPMVLGVTSNTASASTPATLDACVQAIAPWVS